MAIAHGRRLRAEGLEVVAHQLMQFAPLGPARPIDR
jgi:hypothetical protein